MNALLAMCLLASVDVDAMEKKIDTAVAAAIERKDMPGAVVLILHGDRIILRKAYGLRSQTPDPLPMTVDAIFDLASLTKPIATASSVMKLVELGKLKFDDKVSTHWPEFAANDKDAITIEHLLKHTSGLIADNPIADYMDGRTKAMERIAARKLSARPDEKFTYSDVGFIVLGEIVERKSRQSLPDFAKEHIFAPLKMTDTGFTPAKQFHMRIAPTTKLGIVHDPRAALMDGVAGHAGLFGTADDLARFARMLLNDGELDGVRIFKAETVRQFTEPLRVPGGFRSRGWDVDTSYSAPRGDAFKKGTGYGHTGFTGTSIWIDPPSKTAVIILTNRVHPNDKGNVTKLRREIGTIVGEAVR